MSSNNSANGSAEYVLPIEWTSSPVNYRLGTLWASVNRMSVEGVKMMTATLYCGRTLIAGPVSFADDDGVRTRISQGVFKTDDRAGPIAAVASICMMIQGKKKACISAAERCVSGLDLSRASNETAFEVLMKRLSSVEGMLEEGVKESKAGVGPDLSESSFKTKMAEICKFAVCKESVTRPRAYRMFAHGSGLSCLLHGSMATNTHGPDSDMDIVVRGGDDPDAAAAKVRKRMAVTAEFRMSKGRMMRGMFSGLVTDVLVASNAEFVKAAARSRDGLALTVGEGRAAGIRDAMRRLRAALRMASPNASAKGLSSYAVFVIAMFYGMDSNFITNGGCSPSVDAPMSRVLFQPMDGPPPEPMTLMLRMLNKEMDPRKKPEIIDPYDTEKDLCANLSLVNQHKIWMQTRNLACMEIVLKRHDMDCKKGIMSMVLGDKEGTEDTVGKVDGVKYRIRGGTRLKFATGSDDVALRKLAVFDIDEGYEKVVFDLTVPVELKRDPEALARFGNYLHVVGATEGACREIIVTMNSETGRIPSTREFDTILSLLIQDAQPGLMDFEAEWSASMME